MSSYPEYAQREFEVLGWSVDDGPQGIICSQVLALLELFASQGHSGTTGPYALRMLNKLAAHQPLSPLTGADSEWQEAMGGVLQNKRCPRVFKKDGQAYDVEGKAFRDSDGELYEYSDRCVNITFPYTPTTEYIDRPRDADA